MYSTVYTCFISRRASILHVFMLRDGHLGWCWAVTAAGVAVTLVERNLVWKIVPAGGEQG